MQRTQRTAYARGPPRSSFFVPLHLCSFVPAELTGLVPKLSGGPGGGCRPDELSYYETKLVVIQVRVLPPYLAKTLQQMGQARVCRCPTWLCLVVGWKEQQ